MIITMMETGAITTKFINHLVKQSKYSKFMRVKHYKNTGSCEYSRTPYYSICIKNKNTDEIILDIDVDSVDHTNISEYLISVENRTKNSFNKYWDDLKILEAKLELLTKE